MPRLLLSTWAKKGRLAPVTLTLMVLVAGLAMKKKVLAAVEEKTAPCSEAGAARFEALRDDSAVAGSVPLALEVKETREGSEVVFEANRVETQHRLFLDDAAGGVMRLAGNTVVVSGPAGAALFAAGTYAGQVHSRDNTYVYRASAGPVALFRSQPGAARIRSVDDTFVLPYVPQRTAPVVGAGHNRVVRPAFRRAD